MGGSKFHKVQYLRSLTKTATISYMQELLNLFTHHIRFLP